MKLLRRWKQWRLEATSGYGRLVTRAENLQLEEAFDECAGQWVAIDRRTGEVRAAARSPYELSAEIKGRQLKGVDILRAPEHNEPEVVGFG